MVAFPGLRLGRIASSRGLATLLAGAWSFADQGLVSLANFLLMVLLARRLPATEFGAFFLVYMALYLANNVQTSIISRPHNVIGANLGEGAFRQYTARVFSLQLVMTGLFAALGLAFAYGARFFSDSTAVLFAATALALIAWQLQEFARQVQFTRGHAAEVFRYDAISYGGQIALLAALWYFDGLTAVSAMLALAASSAVSACYGFQRIGIRPVGWPFAILRMNWRMGRWVLGDNLGQWLSAMLFPILAAAFVGTAATGVYRLVLNVVAPLHVVFSALPSFASPRASRAYHEGGSKGLRAFVVPMTLLAGLPLTVYLVGAGIFGSELLSLMYGPGYSKHADLIWLFGAAYLAQYLFTAGYVALLATGNARGIFLGRLVSIGLTLTAGVILTAAFGLTGALVGLVVTNLGLCLVVAVILSNGQESVPRVWVRRPPMAVAGASPEAVLLTPRHP